MRVRSALLLLLFGFVGGVAGFLLIQRFGSPEGVNLVEESRLAERRIASRFPKERFPTAGEQKSFRLEESDLRDLALAALASRAEGRQLLAMSNGLEAEIEGGEIGVRLVLDMSKLPLDLLDEEQQEVVDWVSKILPGLTEGAMPIALYGRPEASDGRLKLTGDPRLELSILKLSVETAAERFGLSEQRLRDALEIQWPGWEVVSVTVDGQAVQLVVRPA